MVLHRPVELAAFIGTYAITSGLPTVRELFGGFNCHAWCAVALRLGSLGQWDWRHHHWTKPVHAQSVLVRPARTAKRASGVHAREGAVFVFNLAVDEDSVDSLRKLCGLGVGGTIDDCRRIEYGDVCKIADLNLAPAN